MDVSHSGIIGYRNTFYNTYQKDDAIQEYLGKDGMKV
jgi:hypothetical protein